MADTPRIRGSTVCPSCNRTYKNNAVPAVCKTDDCEYHLGGTFKEKVKCIDSKLITETLASVRLNPQGISKRTFVQMNPLSCQETKCLAKLGALSDSDSQTFRCYHMKQALKAMEMATEHPISQESLGDLSEKQKELVKRIYSDKDIVIYGLPGGNICVPTIEDENEGYTHVMHGKCPMKACQAGGTRVHSLTKKSNPLCLHTYLIFKAGLESGPVKSSVEAPHEIDRQATVLEVTRLIREHFPSATSDRRPFLKQNKDFIEKLCKVKNLNAELLKYSDTKCPTCSNNLEKWKHKTKVSFLISLAQVKKIQVEAKFCTSCKIMLYYNLYAVGCVPVHNKVILSYDYLLELSYLLDSGISLIQVIKDKLQLLCQREDIEEIQDNNLASMIERTSVAVNAILITGHDLDQVICLSCGLAPKILLSDGNSKDTVAVTGNMVYDFTEDNSEVPDLESFKMRLVCQMLRSAYFQNETKENIIMTKLPNIIAPRLVKRQINSDSEKKSLFNKPVNYGSNTMAGLAQLILKQKIDILNLDNLDASEVKNISKALHLKGTSSKSVIRLLEEIKFVCKMYAAGQGPCHEYVQLRGRTGGWTDVWCPHNTKVGSKMEALQESVSDVSDVLHSMKKLPTLHILDDACHFVSHSFLKYPLESQISLGLDRRGCFEPPSETEPPNTGIDCPDILPIGHPANITNKDAMEDESQILHPDCATMQRYVMGTRLQTVKGKKQHKLATCDYHNLDNSKQGADLKTMSQESLQNVRKHRTIQADKLRSVECAFLANYITDFHHNQRKYKEQYTMLLKEFGSVERDSLWRAQCDIKK